MTRPNWTWIALAALAMAGCHGKARQQQSESQPGVAAARDAAPAAAPTPPPRRDTAALWQLAPAEAAVGIVLAEGAGPRLLSGASEAARVLALEPTTRELADRLVASLRIAGVDLADSAAREAAGIDLGGGFALFLDPALAPLAAVLPVADPARLAGPLGGAVESTDAGPPVYRFPSFGMVCVAAGGRTVCGRDRDAIAATGGSGERPLAERIAELGGVLGDGDLELVADLTAIPELDSVRERSRSILADPGLLVLSVGLERGEVRLHGWIEGTPMAPWGTVLSDNRPVPGLEARFQRARSKLRWSLDPARLGAGLGPQLFAGDLELHRDFLDHLSGDVGIFTDGSGPIAGEIALGLTDQEAMRAVVPGLCNALFRPFGRIERLDERGCRVVLELSEVSGDPLAQAVMSRLTGVPVTLSVQDGLLSLRLGPSNPEQLPKPSGQPTAQLAAVVRDLDPLAATDPELAAAAAALVAALAPEQRDRLERSRWLLAQLAEVGIGVRFGTRSCEPRSGYRGFHVDVDIVTFAADPEPVYTAYQAAVVAQRAGEASTYRSAMATIQHTYPDSYAGRHAAALAARTPIMGPGLALLLAAGLPAWTDWSEPAGERSNRRGDKRSRRRRR